MVLKIFVANNPVRESEYGNIFASFTDPAVLQRNGGLLLKAAVEKDKVSLGLLPSFSEGIRNMHYTIRLDSENGYMFTGFFNTDGSLCLIPLAEKGNHGDRPDFAKIAETLLLFLEVLLEYGMNEKTMLDNITTGILSRSGIEFNGPASCREAVISIRKYLS